MEVAERSHELIQEFAKHQKDSGIDNPDPLNITSAFMELTKTMMSEPQKVVEAQLNLWQNYVNLWHSTAQRMMGQETAPVIEPDKGDRRFKSEEWQSNQIFDFIKQSYLLTARWLQDTVHDVEGLDPKTARKVDFYTRQFIDAMAPSNFVMTNPDVLRATLESSGENLVHGLEHMLEDLKRGKGKLAIKMTDLDAFKVGENVAVSPGKVVWQTELMQLIQYTPSTDKVYKRPLLIVPPWINKFYILDLKQENSFIKWAVDQGHTVFVISWVNPDERLAEKTFEDYMFEGIFAALEGIEKAIGERQVNIIGYCLGGTLTAATLAYMKAKGDERIVSATFFTALTDFEDAGELCIFIDEEQLRYLEQRMQDDGGVLDGSTMATTFNMLRANDLIWSFVINNYLMGKDPFPFDLLYWNSDSTRMPAANHRFYLREFYKNNALARGEMTLGGVKLDMSKVTLPVFELATREDHIAPAESVFTGAGLFSGPVEFVLAGSGHIAGVVNPPEKKKYQYWTGKKPTSKKLPSQTLENWLDAATEHAGSWWPHWKKWLEQYSGKLVPARNPGDGPLKAIEDAPGSYVKVRSGVDIGEPAPNSKA